MKQKVDKVKNDWRICHPGEVLISVEDKEIEGYNGILFHNNATGEYKIINRSHVKKMGSIWYINWLNENY